MVDGIIAGVFVFVGQIMILFLFLAILEDTGYMAAHLHDIGKIGVPDNVLNKKGKLLPHEFAQIQLHPTTGFNILSKSKGLKEIGKIVLFHHERCDGKGYPNGLKEKKSLWVLGLLVSVILLTP